MDERGSRSHTANDKTKPAGAPEGGLVTRHFCTDSLPVRDRFPFWKEAICDALANTEMNRGGDGPFRGELRLREFALDASDRVAFSVVNSIAQASRRSKKHVARESEPLFNLCVQIGGSARIDLDGREDPLQPGDLWLTDSTTIGRIEFDAPFEQLILRMPYDRLAPRLPPRQRGGAGIVSSASPLGAVLGEHLGAVSRMIERLDAPECDALLDTTIDLIALAFTAELKKFGGSGTTVRRALVMRAQRFIEARLADPSLSAGLVAGALGISADYLRHLFRDRGTTVGAHIRNRRLERCRDDLADPLHAGEQIAEIALRWGFRDLPWFSRAFRRAFGHSPREHRAEAEERRARSET